MNPLFATLPTTVFEEMSGLAREHGALNLGQGFPDAPGPEDVRAHAAPGRRSTNADRAAAARWAF